MMFLLFSKFFRMTQSERLEKETTGNSSEDKFYTLNLEIPACSIGGYYLLYVRDSVNVHIPLGVNPICSTVDASKDLESNFVSRMYVAVFLRLISDSCSLTSPQKSFVQS